MAKAKANARRTKRVKTKEMPIILLPPGTKVALSAKQIAAALDISPRHFYAMISTGEYPKPDLQPDSKGEGPLGRITRWTQDTHNQWFIKTFGEDKKK